MSDEFIERRICVGLITDTEYLKKVLTIWNPRFLESTTARIICGWCIDYGRQWRKAPGKQIESIYIENIQRIDKESAQWIENILNSLNDEFETDPNINTDYLFQQTEKYFKRRNLLILAEELKIEAEGGDIAEAERLACGFTPVQSPNAEAVNPFTDIQLVKKAFCSKNESLFTYPKALGQFWNYQLVEEGFIALLAPEKRGKSFMLMDLAFRALKKNLKVAFFQAGDMSEEQMIRRMGIYLKGKSDMEKHCGELLIPVLDCKKNQDNSCNHIDREESIAIEGQINDLKSLVVTASHLLRRGTAYQPCRNCRNIDSTIWFRLRPAVRPLTWKEAYKAFRTFRKTYKGARFRMSTHANETLSVSHINMLLDMWAAQDDFLPHVIIIDYADLLTADPDMPRDFRQQTNKIWQRLRSLAQIRKCLVITATQADAQSYDQQLLSLRNFSEDKRKYAHVTAMYGLNQTADEKRAGIMRMNEIVVRDDAFDSANVVCLMQSLQTGRPVLSSFFGNPERR